MFAAASRLLPATARYIRQIIPPVIATLIAAGLISAYNHAFSGHLQQPRLAALHQDAAEPPADSAPVSKPLAATEAIAIYDNIAPPSRLWDKEARQDAGKDQAIKVAVEPAPAPMRAAAPRVEKPEPRRVASFELPPPAVRAPGPVIVAVPPSVVSPPTTPPSVAALPTVQELRQPVYQPQYAQPQYAPPPYVQPPPYQHQQYGQPQQPPYQPPPVITAQPVVTVPDRPRPVGQAQAEPSQGAFGMIVNTLKPSNLFARAREFGEKIEQAGNDILPSIRQ